MANTLCKNDLQFAGLRALAAELPKTRFAQIRSIWPLISAAVHRGHKLTAINDRLREDGFEIPYRTLNRYVNRLRFEDPVSSPSTGKYEATASRRRTREQESNPIVLAIGAVQTAPPKPSGNQPRNEKDPMAAARDYLGGGTKVRGFQFKEGVPDLSKLV